MYKQLNNTKRPKVYHCDHCDFSTYGTTHLDRHNKTAKHISLADPDKFTKQCKLCGDKFTEQGYSTHMKRNGRLIRLWKKRDNWTGVGYNESGWQPFFSEFGGYNGNILPKCNIFKAFGKRYQTEEEMISIIYKTFKSLKNKHISRGCLPGPFEDLEPDEQAPIDWEAIENSYDEYEKNAEVADNAEKVEEQQREEMELLGFHFTDDHLNFGYPLNLSYSQGSFNQVTIKFMEYLDCNCMGEALHKFKNISQQMKAKIFYLPDDDEHRTGGFFLEHLYSEREEFDVDEQIAEYEYDKENPCCIDFHQWEEDMSGIDSSDETISP